MSAKRCEELCNSPLYDFRWRHSKHKRQLLAWSTGCQTKAGLSPLGIHSLNPLGSLSSLHRNCASHFSESRLSRKQRETYGCSHSPLEGAAGEDHERSTGCRAVCIGWKVAMSERENGALLCYEVISRRYKATAIFICFARNPSIG